MDNVQFCIIVGTILMVPNCNILVFIAYYNFVYPFFILECREHFVLKGGWLLRIKDLYSKNSFCVPKKKWLIIKNLLILSMTTLHVVMQMQLSMIMGRSLPILCRWWLIFCSTVFGHHSWFRLHGEVEVCIEGCETLVPATYIGRHHIDGQCLSRYHNRCTAEVIWLLKWFQIVMY